MSNITPKKAAPPASSLPTSPRGYEVPASRSSSVARLEEEGSPSLRVSLRDKLSSKSAREPEGIPKDKLIPHGFENPTLRRSKGPDGLKEHRRSIASQNGKEGDIHLGPFDQGVPEWNNVEPGKPKFPLKHGITTSRVICLILNHQDITGHVEPVQFQVHRNLLYNLNITDSIPFSSSEYHLNSILKPYAISAVIQFLYTGDFTVQDKFGTVEDDEGYFEKLTNIEWTCRYLGAKTCRELTLSKIDYAYKGFEFHINLTGIDMRVQLTEFLYGVVNDSSIQKGDRVDDMRKRIIAGWLRDISLLHNDKSLEERFENLLISYQAFSDQLRHFITIRSLEDINQTRKLVAFEKFHKRALERHEQENMSFQPGVSTPVRHSGIPTLPIKGITGNTHGTTSYDMVGDGTTPTTGTPTTGTPTKPPERKRATRIEDKIEGSSEQSSDPVFQPSSRFSSSH
ncbi:hypothetical protein ABW19_dt0201693 [Dactylella cylindrospora]|nr:hypothetical protein ABW19_dt0201693 [Dactylella cylindrospora]